MKNAPRKFNARPELDQFLSIHGFGHEVCRIVVSRYFVDSKSSRFQPFLHCEHLQLNVFSFDPVLVECTPRVRSVSPSEVAVLFRIAILARVVKLPNLRLLLNQCRTTRLLRSKELSSFAFVPT